MIPAGERLRVVLIAVISVLLVAGTSFAIKKFGRGYEAADYNTSQYYAKYASYGGYGSGAGGGCNSSGCSVASGNRKSLCCSGGGTSLSADEITVEAISYYASKYGDGDVTCEVKDYGCHQEAEIIKDGTVVKKLSINGGRITEI